jgi:hypothetical protein
MSPIIELPGKILSVDHIFYNDDNISPNFDTNSLIRSDVSIYEHHNLLKYCEIYYNYEKRVHVLKFVNFPKSMVIILTCAQET